MQLVICQGAIVVEFSVLHALWAEGLFSVVIKPLPDESNCVQARHDIQEVVAVSGLEAVVDICSVC